MTKSSSSWIVLVAFLVSVIVSASSARADQPSAVEQPAAIKVSDDAVRAAEMAKAEECRDFARQSKIFAAMVKNDLRPVIQEEDARLTMKNKQHVVAAYATLWILTVGFVGLLFLRQRRLLGEIDRLEREVRSAALDDDEQE